MDEVLVAERSVRVVESEVARKAVKIGRKNRMTFRPLTGHGPLLLPVKNDGWRFDVAEKDPAPRPEREIERRKRVLRKAGIKWCQELMAHEIPEPVETDTRDRDWQRQKDTAKDTFIQVGSYLAMVVGSIIASGIMIDPAYVLVLEENGQPGPWLEIVCWDEE